MTRSAIAAATVLTALLAAQPAQANRRAALQGNLLMEDPQDIYIFPQRALDYRNLVRFDVGTADDMGDGLLLFGSPTFAMGIAAHRSDQLSPFAASQLGVDDVTANYLGAPNLFGDVGYDSPFTIADVLVSFEVGAGLAGGRLMIANGGTSTDPDQGEIASKGQSLFLLAGGFSLKGDFRLDMALDLVFGTASEVANGEDVQSGFGFGLELDVRGGMNMGEGVDLGFLGGLGFTNRSLTNEIADDAGSLSVFNFMAGAGPVYRLTDKALIAAYGVLGVTNASSDPSEAAANDDSSSTVTSIPAMRLAGEFWLTEWFAFRAGLEYSYRINLVTAANGDETAFFDGTFGWSAGVGFTKGDFAFDGALSHLYLTAGPDFIGGDGDLFTTVSASYTF